MATALEPALDVPLPAPLAAPLAAAPRRRGIVFVCLAAAGVGFALNVQLALNSNFVGQEMHLTGWEVGKLEACRESCGIFALGILAVLAALLAEPLIGAVMLLLLGVGLGSYMWVPNYFWLVLASLVWSQGLHVWMPLPNSMALALAEPGRAGRRLGQVQAAGAVGAAAGLVVVLALHLAGVAIRPLYLVGGAAALLGAAACLGVPRQLKPARAPRLVFRRRYGLYYLLTFLEGWRKQICIAFAGYLLVTQHHTPLTTLLLLWITIQSVGWFMSPAVGRWLDRAGERRVLLFYYGAMTVLFTSYALVDHPYVLYGVYILDNAFFAFTMGLTTYVNRIAPPAEHTPTLSMGVAMNHIAAVSMPLAGGLLWKHAGHRWAFLTGVVTAGLSMGATLALPGRKTMEPPMSLDGHSRNR